MAAWRLERLRMRREVLQLRMDRAMVERHLAEAEAHVVRGGDLIARQQGLIAELAWDGHDTAEAKRLLTTLEATQALLLAHRDLVRRELADLS